MTGYDSGNLFWIGVQRSKGRRGVHAAWECGRWSEPYLVNEHSTFDGCLDMHADKRATAADWTELGRLYVDYCKPKEIRHA